jgi:hypothetical protein
VLYRNNSRVAFRWRHLTALARITASGFGRPVARHGGSAGSAESVTACHGWASDFSLERELGRRSAAMMVCGGKDFSDAEDWRRFNLLPTIRSAP